MKSSLAFLPVASGLLVLVLSLALAFLTTVTRKDLGAGQSTAVQATVATATISLSPASGEFDFKPGQSYPVGILVESAGKSLDGADVVISYDPSKVQISDGKVNPSSMFQEFPLNKVDQAAGKIRFSGLTFNAKSVSGIAGTFSFKPLAKGEVNFTVEYIPGATTDSNLAEHGSALDVLGGVSSARYILK